MSSTGNYKIIGKKIKEARQEAMISQKELAKRLGYEKHDTLSKMENGLVSPYKKLEQIAVLTNKPIAWFMEKNPHSLGWKAQKYDDLCQHLQNFFSLPLNKHYTEMTEPELAQILGSLGLYTPFYQKLLKMVPVLTEYQEQELLHILDSFREKYGAA